jgi:hypothetical protein
MENLMSVTYPSSPSSSAVSGETAAYGGFIDALGGIATIVLAIIGLSGVKSEVLVSISTIVFGAALLIQAGALLGEFSKVETEQDTDVGTGGGGLSVLFLVGIAGLVLGVLALLNIHAAVLTAAAVIAFGAALLISSWAVWQLLTSPLIAARFRTHAPMVRLIASEAAAGSAGLQAMAGLAVIVLGVLAICGIYTVPLTLTALLVSGASIVMTGSALSGTMVGLMRPTATATTR